MLHIIQHGHHAVGSAMRVNVTITLARFFMEFALFLISYGLGIRRYSHGDRK